MLCEIRSSSKTLTRDSDANEEITLYFKKDILHCSEEKKIYAQRKQQFSCFRFLN